MVRVTSEGFDKVGFALLNLTPTERPQSKSRRAVPFDRLGNLKLLVRRFLAIQLRRRARTYRLDDDFRVFQFVGKRIDYFGAKCAGPNIGCLREDQQKNNSFCEIQHSSTRVPAILMMSRF